MKSSWMFDCRNVRVPLSSLKPSSTPGIILLPHLYIPELLWFFHAPLIVQPAEGKKRIFKPKHTEDTKVFMYF